MFENVLKFFKGMSKKKQNEIQSKDTAKERLHLVLMQDRANVSADFLELMKQEIIEVIKKYVEVDEKSIDVRLTNKSNDDGTNGAPALYANIPIVNIRNDMKKEIIKEEKKEKAEDDNKNKENNENKENAQEKENEAKNEEKEISKNNNIDKTKIENNGSNEVKNKPEENKKEETKAKEKNDITEKKGVEKKKNKKVVNSKN